MRGRMRPGLIRGTARLNISQLACPQSRLAGIGCAIVDNKIQCAMLLESIEVCSLELEDLIESAKFSTPNFSTEACMKKKSKFARAHSRVTDLKHPHSVILTFTLHSANVVSTYVDFLLRSVCESSVADH